MARDSDADLIARFLRGEKKAAELVDDWLTRASWSYRQRLGDDLEDLLQDVRLELTRLLRAGRFRGESQLKTFVWRVVVHACIDRIRSFRPQVDFENVAEILQQEGLLLDLDAPRHDDRDLMRRVLGQLDAACRRLFLLLAAGLSFAEMAQKVGVAAGTLRVRAMRCRRRAIAARDELLQERPADSL